MPRLTAYERGYVDGVGGLRNHRTRVYEGSKAEKEYWNGYAAGVAIANPGQRIVQCEREGKIFATANVDDCTCPTCGRRYIDGESDRKLTILK